MLCMIVSLIAYICMIVSVSVQHVACRKSVSRLFSSFIIFQAYYLNAANCFVSVCLFFPTDLFFNELEGQEYVIRYKLTCY